MSFCTNCGAELPENETRCPQCGFDSAPAQPAAPVVNVNTNSAPAPVSTGGLLAWSIITLLLCTIPGIVAIIQTCNINKSATEEEQQKKLKSAKTWCIVGTVLGVLALIGSLASAFM